MKNSTTASRPWGLLLTGMVALALAFPCMQALAQDDEEDESSEVIELEEEDLACLECHDDPSLETKLESGEVLSLHISTKAFLGSMHNENSCADCHYEIDIEDHGQGQSTITSKRELGVSM
ncbi:MAG TPA: hypothetical protein VN259_08955, partial [Xanthomonadales bacterium]|nr:hypothetical protein [Xanthomonadales bacterium]